MISEQIAMERTGVCNGELSGIPKSSKSGLFTSRGASNLPSGFSMDDEYWDWKVILKNIENIENIEQDTAPDGLNKHRLPKLPRLGKHGIPWPWKDDACPDDVDETYMFREFSQRLVTLKDRCDPKHTTEESPATMLIEYVVQYYETGGKCHLFGWRHTLWNSHISNYSFGRGVFQKMANGTDRPIRPGVHVKTGCNVLLPRNMKTD